MNFTPQLINDLILIKPTVHVDYRGYFSETFRQDLFEDALGYKVDFIQDNHRNIYNNACEYADEIESTKKTKS